MNELLSIGVQLIEIRKLLNWSQDELAKKIGISRPTILNIEKDPTKMSKTIALALFAVVAYEIEERSKSVKLINYESWDDPSIRESIINEIKKHGQISAAVIGLSLFTNPIISTVAALTAITSLFAKPSKAAEKKEIQANEVRNIVNETMDSIKHKLASCFGLETLDLIQFVKKIDGTDQAEGNI